MFENFPLIPNDIIKEYQQYGIVYLEDSSFEYEGIKFYGTPYQPYFCDWAFNVKNSEYLKEVYRMIPDDVDVLLTHCPPYGILDQTHKYSFDNLTGEKHLGSIELSQVLNEKSQNNTMPKVVAFGHIHGDGGRKVKIDNTIYINASLCNENYDPVNNIISIDLS